MKKISRILKAATESFTMGAGVAGIVMGVVTALTAPPVFVTFVVACGVGLICAVVSGCQEADLIRTEELRNNRNDTRQDRYYLEIKEELDEIKSELEMQHQELSSELREIGLLARSDQAQLRMNPAQVPVEPQQRNERDALNTRASLLFFNAEDASNRLPLSEEKQNPVNEGAFNETKETEADENSAKAAHNCYRSS